MSVCRCTDTEVCFPCRERIREASAQIDAGQFKTLDEIRRKYGREAHPKPDAPGLGPDAASPSGEAPDVEPATETDKATDTAALGDALSDSVAPATDEQIAGYEMRTFREAWRVEDWEYALDGAIARVRQERAGRDRAMAYAVEQAAEVNRLREQVAAMQAADAGAFW